MRAWLSLGAAGLLCAGTFSGPVHAGVFAFDFDSDDDPSTIENSIQAEVGELVEAYLVLAELPDPYTHLWAMQFGLAHSDGLEFRGMSRIDGRGAVISDGVEAMAWAFGDSPFSSEDLPTFMIRYVFRVSSEDVQTVALGPALPWGDETIELLLGDNRGGASIRDPAFTDDQLRGVVNDATPVLEITWSRVKELYTPS